MPPAPPEVQRGLGRRWRLLLRELRAMQAAHPSAGLPSLVSLLDAWGPQRLGPGLPAALDPSPPPLGRSRTDGSAAALQTPLP